MPIRRVRARMCGGVDATVGIAVWGDGGDCGQSGSAEIVFNRLDDG